MPALACFLLEKGGRITDQAIAHYRNRAAGGPSMVIMEACAVAAEGVVSQHQARIDHDRCIDGLAGIAQVIKTEGAIAAVQIHHAGRQTSSRVIGRKPVAPSPLPCPTINGEVTPLSIDGIQALVEKFGEAAVRARQAGFDLIEVHGAHGYLLNQFLSGFSNIRQDQYGIDTIGRSRFAVEIVREIRRRLGSEFPLSFKISAREFLDGGLTVAESIAIIKRLIDAGIDVVQVSAGNDATPEWICQPSFMPKACLADAAQSIKQAVTIPVMSVGRINHPLTAEQVIAADQADLVCMGRGLIADPDMPRKIQQGRFEDIRPCIGCNGCMNAIFKKGHIECTVNPSLGHETEISYAPAKHGKKIMVVGGGPGGLTAACTAARRGHRVHLFEQTNALGGKLIVGSKPDHKKELLDLIRYLDSRVEKWGVHCHLGHRVTLATVSSFQPDTVVLATGAVPYFPSIEGIDDTRVTAVENSLGQSFGGHENVVVIGGGASGCEAALHISQQGCQVTVIERLDQLCHDLESSTKSVLLKKMKASGVDILTGCQVTRIADQGVVLQDPNSVVRSLAADHIVIAAGNTSNTGGFEAITSLGLECYSIGDCAKPRSIKEAIHEGDAVGRLI
jgi:2,4-dienoyl-CoA reductase-like NADH-dependent reductase (Old Yellow Enzyme family)/thioredoxin reductase